MARIRSSSSSSSCSAVVTGVSGASTRSVGRFGSVGSLEKEKDVEHSPQNVLKKWQKIRVLNCKKRWRKETVLFPTTLNLNVLVLGNNLWTGRFCSNSTLSTLNLPLTHSFTHSQSRDPQISYAPSSRETFLVVSGRRTPSWGCIPAATGEFSFWGATNWARASLAYSLHPCDCGQHSPRWNSVLHPKSIDPLYDVYYAC